MVAKIKGMVYRRLVEKWQKQYSYGKLTFKQLERKLKELNKEYGIK